MHCAKLLCGEEPLMGYWFSGPWSTPPGNEERRSTVSSMRPARRWPSPPSLLEASFRGRPENTGTQPDRPDRSGSRRPESQDRRRASGSGGDSGPTSAPSSQATEEITSAVVPRDQPSRAPGALRGIRLVRRRLPAGRRETESRRPQRGLPSRELPASPTLRRGIALPSVQGGPPTDVRLRGTPSSELVYPGVGFFEVSGSQQARLVRFLPFSRWR